MNRYPGDGAGQPAFARSRNRAALLASVAVISLGYAATAHAVSSGPTSPIIADGVALGPYADADINAGLGGTAVTATNNGSVTITSGELSSQSSTSNRGWGVLAGNGGEITLTADITTSGARGHAVQAGFNGTSSATYDGSSAGVITVTGGSIATNGDYATGLHAVDGGSINATGVTITTAGPNSPTVHAESNSTISLTGATLSVTGGNSVGVLANNDRAGATGGHVNLTNTNITTTLDYGYGVFANAGGSVDITGGLIKTSGGWGWGVGAKGEGTLVTVDNAGISTTGERAYGLHAFNDAIIRGSANITTTADRSHAVQAGANGTNTNPYPSGSRGVIELTGGTIATAGYYATALHIVDAGHITANNITITNTGASGHGAHVESASTVAITDSVINVSGANAHGIHANNDKAGATGGVATLVNTTINVTGANGFGVDLAAGASASITGGLISTTQSWSHGVSSRGTGTSATLVGAGVATSGERAFGLLAHTGGAISGSANVVTQGDRAHAVQAGANGTSGATYPTGSAGTVALTDSTLSTAGYYAVGLHSVDASTITGARVNITTTGAAGFGVHAESESSVSLQDSSIITSGASAHGVVANNDRAGATGGVATLTNVNVTVSGADASAAVAAAGGTLNIEGGVYAATGAQGAGILVVDGGQLNVRGAQIASTQAAGLQLVGSSTLTLDNVTIAGGTAAIGAAFTGANQNVSVTVEDGSRLSSTSGVLLNVNRDAADAGSGVVQLTLADGSTSVGDINDLGAKTTGYTDVLIEANASWTGVTRGVRNFASQQGGDLNFDAGSVIGGDLNLTGASVQFGPGVQIGGNVNIGPGSRTTGGTISNPVVVFGDTHVDAGGVMGGNWRLTSLFNHGAISPGNSIGVVTVAGDVSLGATSVYHAEINAAGEADLIAATGKAQLGGSLQVSAYPANGGYLIATPYTVLTAEGGFDGTTFDGGVVWTGTPLSPFLSPYVSYDATSVFVTIGRSDVTLASTAGTPNEFAVAAALDQAPLSSPLVQAVTRQTTALNARQAFNALSGELYSSVSGALVEDSDVVRDAVNSRLRQAFGNGVNAAQSAQTQNVSGLNATIWGQGFGGWGHASSPTTAKVDRSSAGFIAGVDAAIADIWRVGVAGGYGRTSMDVDQRISSAHADTYHLAVYGGARFGAIGLRFGGAHAWNDISANRGVTFAGFADATRSSYRAGVSQVFGEVGYTAQFDRTTVEPFFSVAWVGMDTARFAEAGGLAALNARTASLNTTFTTLGARVSHSFALANGADLTARGAIGWRHALGDVNPRSVMALAGTNTLFSVEGAPIARNSLMLEAGLDVTLMPNVSLGVAWVGQIADRAQDHSLKGSFNARF